MDRTMIEKRLKFHTERLDNLYAAYNALVNSRAKSYRLDDRELTRFDLDTLSDEIEDAERKVEELTALLNGQSARKAFGVIPITAIFAMLQTSLIKRFSIEPATDAASDIERGDITKG